MVMAKATSFLRSAAILVLAGSAVACAGSHIARPDADVPPARAEQPLAVSPNASGDGGTRLVEATGGAGEYRLGPEDLLEIQVFGVEELSRTVRVNARGNVSLPLIGSVVAAGLTSDELEEAIARLLAADYMQDPQVSVFIEEYTSQRVTIEGYVNAPGMYALRGRTTLIQSIALAGGLHELANAERIVVFRSEAQQVHALEFNLDEIRKGSARDPVISGNDIIVVDNAAGRTFIYAVANTLRGFVGFGALR
jgi:polysaccharide biosynthesis/export protein